MEPVMDTADQLGKPDDFDVLDPPPQTESSQRYDAFISYSHEPDTDIAPRIEQALERIAKPLLKRRALRVFRDSTGLGAGGELWPQICAAMDASEWLVLLCSVRGATVEPGRPDWVGRELRRWLATKGPGRIILVLTDGPLASGAERAPERRGGLVWDETLGDFDPVASPSLHPVLFGVFPRQPLWANLSEARDDPAMTYEHRGFVELLGQAIGGLHGKPPNEVFGEDLRIHKRTRRLTVGAIAALSALLLTAVGAGAVAVANEREATKQRAAATSRELAAQSMAWTGPRALLLAAEAYNTDPTAEATSALLTAIDDPVTAPDSDNRSLVASFTHQGPAVASAASADGSRLATLDEDAMLSIWAMEPRAPRTVTAADGDRLAWAGDTHIAIASGGTLTWIDASTGEESGTVEVGDRVTALGSGETGVLVGTGSGAVARLAPGDVAPDLVSDEHVTSVGLVRETASGVVSADDNGRVITRDPATLALRTVVTATAAGFTDVTADGTAIVAPSSARGGDTSELAVVVDVTTGERAGALITTDFVTPLDAVFTGVGDEVAVLARADLGNTVVYRGDPDVDERVSAEAAVIESTGLEGRVAVPSRPTRFLHGLAPGTVGVVGSDATVLSELLTTNDGADLEFDLLTGPTAPLSVAPATGAMLMRAEGLALADLTAVQGQGQTATAPVTELGFMGDSGWLTPDGTHVLAAFDSGGVIVQARPGGSGWLVPEPELSVVPAASLDGRYVAYGVAGLLGSSTILVVDATTGEMVASVQSSDPLCAELSCSTTWRMSALALTSDGSYLAVRTARVEPQLTGVPARPGAEPYVVLYDLTSGGTGAAPIPEMDPVLGTQGFEAAASQGPVVQGVEVARYPAATSSVPTFGEDDVLRFHDGRRSVLAIDPSEPGEARVTASQAAGRWVLDERGRPVAAVGCTISVLDDQAQPVAAPPRDEAACNDRDVAWISGSRTLVMDGTRLLPTDSTVLRDLACQLAGRNLTESEWSQFKGDSPYRATCADQPTPVALALATAVAAPDTEAAGEPADPEPDPAAAAETDDGLAFPLERIIVQPGLPDPPHEVSDLSEFAGRAELLGFLRDYLGGDLGDERAEAQACFMEPVPPPAPETIPAPPPPPGVTAEPEPVPEVTPEPWERVRCVGLIRADADSMVGIDFAEDVPLDWLLLEPDGAQWGISATYRRADNPVPPQWVADLLR